MSSKHFFRLTITSLRPYVRLKTPLFNCRPYSYARKFIHSLNTFQTSFLAISFPVFTSLTFLTKSLDIKIEEGLIKTSDELFDEARYEESYKVIESLKDTDNVEILWRLCRGLFNMQTDKNVSKSDSKALIQEADTYIQKALKLNSNHYAVHKWFAIILNAKTTIEGTKAKLAALPTFKKHIEKAIELNPQDPTSMHMLGTYFFNLANLPFYQKKIASALFGKVPDASFEEALSAFVKAEETSPNFYSLNLLMLGKTYLLLGIKDSAILWLQKASTYLVKTEEDKSVQKEALELLKTLR